MGLSGGCHCGAVRYEVEGEPIHAALCHCTDCRKSAGAPMVAWAAFAEENFRVTQGEAVTHNSSGASYRSFCPRCGTGLWFRNAENLPGIVDVQGDHTVIAQALGQQRPGCEFLFHAADRPRCR